VAPAASAKRSAKTNGSGAASGADARTVASNGSALPPAARTSAAVACDAVTVTSPVVASML
jgi:hypothetical protein